MYYSVIAIKGFVIELNPMEQLLNIFIMHIYEQRFHFLLFSSYTLYW